MKMEIRVANEIRPRHVQQFFWRVFVIPRNVDTTHADKAIVCDSEKSTT